MPVRSRDQSLSTCIPIRYAVLLLSESLGCAKLEGGFGGRTCRGNMIILSFLLDQVRGSH